MKSLDILRKNKDRLIERRNKLDTAIQTTNMDIAREVEREFIAAEAGQGKKAKTQALDRFPPMHNNRQPGNAMLPREQGSVLLRDETKR